MKDKKEITELNFLHDVTVNGEPYIGELTVGDLIESGDNSWIVLGINEDAIVIKKLEVLNENRNSEDS